MSKTNSFELQKLKLIFLNEGIAELGDATGIPPSATEGNLYISLYSVMPTDSINGTEATFSGYSRVAIPRNSTYWEVTGTTYARNKLAITFPASSSVETIVGCGISFTNVDICLLSFFYMCLYTKDRTFNKLV